MLLAAYGSDSKVSASEWFEADQRNDHDLDVGGVVLLVLREEKLHSGVGVVKRLMLVPSREKLTR